MALRAEQIQELYKKAEENECVLLEAIKTAYAPGFIRLISLAKSGIIGNIKNVDATFTKLVNGDVRELKASSAGGSVTELASYPLLAIVKLLGTQYEDYNFYSYYDESQNIYLFTKINLKYKNAIATAKVRLGVKSEGDLIISGTKGYIYVPAPWWKTEYFEVRYEDFNKNKKYFYKFEGDGLRYELAEFVTMIHKGDLRTYKLMSIESYTIANIIEQFREGVNVMKI